MNYRNIKSGIMSVMGLSLLLGFMPTSQAEQQFIDHGVIQIAFNCEAKRADYVVHKTTKDRAQNERVKPFTLDPKLPKHCQSKTTYSFKTPKGFAKYDRGHLIAQNIVDNSVEHMKITNYFSNIVPMAAQQNRRYLWRETEKLEECLRDTKGPLTIIAGVIEGDNKLNDYFLLSHGMATPDELYKIIIDGQGNVLALKMPNNNTPKVQNAEKYIVTIAEIEQAAGYTFSFVAPSQRNQKAEHFWQAQRCDLS